MKMITRWIIVLFLVLLQGCSKDDSSKVDDGVTNKNGRFLDSYVGGLNYFTDTKSGVTDEDGKFDFVAGETVTFLVGDIIIGSAPAKEIMSPIDIAASENADINSAEVKNIAAFLQSLDSDGNPNNGIQISEATVAAIGDFNIDFTEPIEKVLGEIIGVVNLTNESNLQVVYPEEAAIHLAESLGENYVVQDSPFLTFIPTLESWMKRPFTSVYWLHEADKEGKLISSTIFEKFPNQILSQFIYLEQNSAGVPLKYKIEGQMKADFGNAEVVEITYSESQLVTGLNLLHPDGTVIEKIAFPNLDEDLKVSEALYFDGTGEFSHRKTFSYKESGNREQSSRYNNETGENAADLDSINNYSYTDFGDFDMVESQGYAENNRRIRVFEYREDHSLEKIITTYPDLNSNPRNEELYFNEAEQKMRWKVTTGDYLVDFLYNVDEEGTNVIKSYFKGRLYEIITEISDGSSIWKTIEEDGSYKLEYRDPESTIFKTEYYDSAGNLLQVE